MALLLPLLAVATSFEPGDNAKLLGWTADGHYLVWTKTLLASSPADERDMGPGATLESVSLAIVRDVRRGDEQPFVLKYKALTKNGGTSGELKKKYATAGDAKAFDAWKKAHPLTVTAGRKGAGAVDVTVKFSDDSEEKPPKWRGNTMKWEVINTATVTLAVTCGKEARTFQLDQSMQAMYAPTWSVTPYWDPSGRRVLFQLQEAIAKTMRGPAGGSVQYAIVSCGARVEVLAPAGLEQATGKIADAVDATAGFSVASIGTAKQQREKTVIYADPQHMEVAATLAKAIPGGATVDKLDWKPMAELVVAIGASAK